MISRFELAMKIAECVSSFLIENRKKGLSISEKGKNDYVTDSDKASERLIRKMIEESYPDDEILGEEYGISGRSESLWIIDPIDGTVNFMNGFPMYCISIAYQEKGVTQFGVVAVPEQGEIFHAELGKGAYLNGESIRVSTIIPSEGLALLVPPHRVHSELDGYIKSMRRLYELYSDVRSIGSAALSLCYVASGRACCYYERFLHIYDVAAGLLIAQEAGAEIETVEKDGFIDVVAASSGLLEPTKRMIDGQTDTI